MRIATEIGWGHKAGGPRRVAINTLLEMVKLRSDNKYIVYSNCGHAQLDNTQILQKTLSAPFFIPQLIWDQFLFPHVAVPIAVKKDKPDLIHYTNHIVSYWGSIPSVVNIFDMVPFIYPEMFLYLHAIYLRSYYKFSAKKAKRIITISENSKKDICRFLDVKEDKISVVPLAPGIKEGDIEKVDKTELKNAFNIEKPFILYAGAIHPRKNIKRLIEAYHLLKRKKDIPHQLVIAGAFRWKTQQAIKTPVLDMVKDDVIFTGRINDSYLASLYSNCDVFVYPSLYEGFGIPVLEAMSFKAPVVVSNTSSFPEVVGNAAVLVDPESSEEISNGIWQILDKPDFANDLRSKGVERLSKFSWEITARKVLEILEHVA